MASTMFQKAKHTQISGGNFSTIVNNNFNQQYRNEMKDLRKYCALGTLLDSSERFHSPRCAPETREALIDEILAWIYGGGDSASMAWLFGGAGAGKSALAQTIAEICKEKGYLVASFFFLRTSATTERSDGKRLIPTLVLQLLEAFPDLKPHIAETIDQHAALFERSPRTQMDLLFIRPLTKLKMQSMPMQTLLDSERENLSTPSLLPTQLPPSPLKTQKSKLRQSGFIAKVLHKFKAESEAGPAETSLPSQTDVATTAAEATGLAHFLRPRLIVVDGLDECNGQDIQVELLRIFASAIPLLSFPIRFLVASRPEGYITRTFDHDESFRLLDVRKIDLGNDPNADDDIRRFLTRGFQEIRRTHPFRTFLSPSWPPNHAIAILVQKSSSHFIYASTAMKYMQYSRGRPDKRLDVILGLSVPPTLDKPFAELDALYTHIFMTMDECDRKSINHVLGIMFFSDQDKFAYYIGTSPVELEEYLAMESGEINLLFEPLLSLVALPESRDDDIRVLHTSLIDFLLDFSRSGDLHLDLQVANDVLAKYWFNSMLALKVDDILLTPVVDDKSRVFHHQTPCLRFLTHCRYGCLSHELKEYLTTFPFLYNVILHPMLINIYPTKSYYRGHNNIPILLEIFFNLLLEKDFDNGQQLHHVHTSQIEKRFRSIHGEWHPNLLKDMDQEPLFEDIFYQNRHCVYKAYLNVVLTIPGIEMPSQHLLNEVVSWGPGNAGYNIRSHFLVMFLPYMNYEHIEFYKIYPEWMSWASWLVRRNEELFQIVQQRAEEYIQRIERDAGIDELRKCKEGWGLKLVNMTE